MSRSSLTFGVIGGGIVGLATALNLRQVCPRSKIVVWEKEKKVGEHQSSHNSGVLHAGLYYKPGSLKARLAVSGIRRMVAFCQQHGVRHEICGKLVVATDRLEVARLRTLMDRGLQNGLLGLRFLSGSELREIEPHAKGLAAVHVPEEGIVDYAAVCCAMRRELEAGGVQVVTSAHVSEVIRKSALWSVGTNCEHWEVDFLVNCGGLHSDRIARLAGERGVPQIVPFRGEYFHMKGDSAGLVKNLIYPVPDPTFPFLGVHFTRMINGGVEAGPNAVLALSREGYSWGHVNGRDIAEALVYPGLWRFVSQHLSMTCDEISRSVSKRRFCASLQRLVPAVQETDLVVGGAGVRAQAMLPDGRMLQDFHFIRGRNTLHVLNAPSPGATASLAIGEYIADEIMRGL